MKLPTSLILIYFILWDVNEARTLEDEARTLEADAKAEARILEAEATKFSSRG